MKTIQVKLVDTLKHLGDHALAMDFVDPKLKALVQELKKDGSTRIEAGQSHITLRTVGRVTFTHLYLAHGSYNIENVHYLDEPGGLKFTHKESENEEAYETLVAVILGQKLPYIWRPGMGCDQDTFRHWAKTWGWSLLGEAGLRAKAVAKGEESLECSVRVTKQNIGYEEDRLSIFDRRDFDDEVKQARKACKAQLKRYHAKDDTLKRHVGNLGLDNPTDALRALGMGSQYIYPDNKYGVWSEGRYQWLYHGTPPSTDPPILRANYTATREGDEIRLSSGIVCEVDVPQALAWLRGEVSAPVTRYGACTMHEASTPEGLPIKIVKCGCHYLDLRNLGEDFAALLVPTHTVTKTEGTPTLTWDEHKEQCIERMKAYAQEQFKQNHDYRARAVESFFTEKKELLAIKANKEEYKAEMRAKIEKLKGELEVAEKNLDDYQSQIMTGTLETLMGNVISACNVLAGIRIN